MMTHATTDVTIHNRYGFHVRPSTSFSQLAMRFPCDIEVGTTEQVVDGKSVMGLMTLGAVCGAVISIRAEGDQAEEAVKALKDLVESSFGGID